MKDLTRPHSLEAERALLGAILRDPELLVEIAEIAGPADFYRQDHGKLMRLMLDMHRVGMPVDNVSVPERIHVLHGDNDDEFGGIEYVTQLEDHCPSTVNFRYYAEVVAKLARNRAVMDAAQKAFSDASQRADTEDLLDHLARTVDDLRTRSMREIRTGEEVVGDLCVELLSPISASIPSGFQALDDMLGGLAPGRVTVIAGRPAMGKSALAGCIAFEWGANARRVHIQSLEMQAKEWYLRAGCSVSKTPMSATQKRPMDNDTFDRLQGGLGWAERQPLIIDDQAGRTVEQIKASAKRTASRLGGLDLIVLDYAQLVQANDPRQNRREAVGDLSRAIKELAKSMGCHVILLAQVNRQCEQRADKRPLMADLKESGDLEQDADAVCFVYRPTVYDDCADPTDAEIIVRKNRHGPCGEVAVRFDGEFLLFRDVPTLRAVDDRWTGTADDVLDADYPLPGRRR